MVNKRKVIIKMYTILVIDLNPSFDSPKKMHMMWGEWFKFRIHYGFVNAGYATLEVKMQL
jgi:hypothetical protein